MHALLAAIARMPSSPEARRIFHGRGGLYPGCEHWTLDLYPPVCLTTSFLPAGDDELATLGTALAARWSEIHPGEPLNWVHQYRFEARADTRLMAGQVPEPHVVSEAGTRYRVHLLKGLNHGFFLDMAAGRQWVREQVATRPGARVLNLFAYTCAFSVVALQAGAERVVNVDMSDGALAIGKRNHLLNGIESGARFLPHDIFCSWARIKRDGPYDLVIFDPPSYQKGSFIAEKDYPRLLRRLPALLAPGGHALLGLNSPKLDAGFLQAHMQDCAPEMVFVQRLANPPAFADAEPERALKVLIYHRPA